MCKCYANSVLQFRGCWAEPYSRLCWISTRAAITHSLYWPALMHLKRCNHNFCRSWVVVNMFLHYHHSAMLLSYCFFWCRSLALHETPSLLLYFHTLSFALLQCIAGLTGNANILARKTVTALSALLLCLFLGVGERKKSEREPCFQDLEHQECRPCLESKTTSLKDSVKKEKVCLVQISPSRFCLSTTWNAQALNLNAICSPCLHKSKFTQSLHPTIGLCTVQQFLM